MAARVDVDAVKLIIETKLTDPQINAFIDTAHQIVEDVLDGEGLTEETLTEIECYLSAHLVCLRDPRASAEKIGSEYSATWQGDTSKGLEATHYGQTALILDTTGKLTTASMPLRQASFKVHGTNDP